MRRQHIWSLIGYTSRRFWMLLIPLIRSLTAVRIQDGFDTIRFDMLEWAKGTKWDIAVVALMILAAFWRWFFTWYSISDDKITIMQGFIFRSQSVILYDNISAAAVQEDPFCLLLRISKVMIDTDSPSSTKRSSDISLVMPLGDRQKLLSGLSSHFVGEQTLKSSYTIPLDLMMIFSFFFSSALSGVILIMTTLSVSTSIIGEKLENDLIKLVGGLSDTLSDFIGQVVSGIDPAGIAISIVIGAGFVMSFLFNMVRHLNFRILRRGKCIIISTGAVIRRIYCINVRKINMTDMRQNLLMKVFGLASVHISCTGYGKRTREIPVFIPICGTRTEGKKKSRFSYLENVMEQILPEFVSRTDYIRPKTLFAWRFIWPPALPVILIPVITMILIIVLPYWHELLRFLAIIAEIPAMWLLFVKAAAFYTTGFDLNENGISARFCSWYSFHSIYIPADRLCKIAIRRDILQRFNGTCDVVVFPNGERSQGQRINALPVLEMQKQMRNIF
ncbi:MAG: PH domain-containing protein [Oscillospiraceae bacterium]|nr:PH domain-containing protein [Oscillospiraceae bacterium]